MSRGPGVIQRFVLMHLGALQGEWCPTPDLAAAYALAAGVPLVERQGRLNWHRFRSAPRSVEESVYRAVRTLADRRTIETKGNGYGLFMDARHSGLPGWFTCARDPSFPDPGWVMRRREECDRPWRERCRTPLISVA